MADEKLPPHDIEAEEAVIGSLLIDPEALLKIAASLKPEDLFSETNRAIYQACFSLYQRNEVINQITVAHELMRQDKLEQIGGAAFLSHLISNVPTSLHVEYYAQIVSNTAVMRRLIAAARQIEALGYEASPNVEAASMTPKISCLRCEPGRVFEAFLPFVSFWVSILREVGRLRRLGQVKYLTF